MKRRVLGLLALAACSSPPRLVLPGGEAGIGFDDLRFSPRLGRVLVPAARTGDIDLVDPATQAITRLSGFSTSPTYDGGHDFGVTSVDDTGRWLLATDRTRGELAVVDPETRAIVATAPLASGPDYVRWVPSTREAWVTEPSSDQLEVFAIGDGAPPVVTQAAIIPVPGGPESLVIDETRGRAYAHLWDGRSIAVDLATRAIVADWPNGCSSSRGIALDEERGFLFAACREGRVAVLSVDDGRELGSVWATDGVDVIDYSPRLHHLYAPGQLSANLAIVGVASDGTAAVLGLVDTALGAHCVAADDQGGLWVCDPDAGALIHRADPYDAVTR